MDEPIAGLIAFVCIAGTLLVAVVALVSVRGQRRRRREMQQWADANGWSLTRQPNVDWGRQLPGGNRRGIEFLFSTMIDGRRVDVAEYSVTDAGGVDGTAQSTHFWVVTSTTLIRPLPQIRLEPRNPLSRLKQKMLGPGNASTGDPEFDRRFRIETTNHGALNHWLSPHLIAGQIHGQVPPSWTVNGTHLLGHQPGRLSLGGIPAHARRVHVLANMLDTGRP